MVTLSYSYTVILSHGHMVTLSHCYTITWWNCHTVTLSHGHTVTWSNFHTVTYLHCLMITLSHSHLVRLSFHYIKELTLSQVRPSLRDLNCVGTLCIKLFKLLNICTEIGMKMRGEMCWVLKACNLYTFVFCPKWFRQT